MDKKTPGTKERALDDISSMLKRYAGTKKEHLLASWLSAYSKFIKQEETFKPQYLKRYKRGEIIKVNFGYRLGSEQGGPHYAIVLDKDNSTYSDIITVLPLSSKKDSTKLNKYTLDLGNEIYLSLKRKAQIAFSKSIKNVKITPETAKPGQEVEISIEIDDSNVQPIMDEIDSMKEGSVALISQITSISKMRIIKPKRTTEALSGIRLSDDSLNKIDEQICKLYIGKK